MCICWNWWLKTNAIAITCNKTHSWSAAWSREGILLVPEWGRLEREQKNNSQVVQSVNRIPCDEYSTSCIYGVAIEFTWEGAVNGVGKVLRGCVWVVGLLGKIVAARDERFSHELGPWGGKCDAKFSIKRFDKLGEFLERSKEAMRCWKGCFHLREFFFWRVSLFFHQDHMGRTFLKKRKNARVVGTYHGRWWVWKWQKKRKCFNLGRLVAWCRAISSVIGYIPL